MDVKRSGLWVRSASLARAGVREQSKLPDTPASPLVELIVYRAEPFVDITLIITILFIDEDR